MRSVLSIAFWIFVTIFFVPSVIAGDVQRGSISTQSQIQELSYLIYLPDGYDGGLMRYPVLYLLHGADDTETAWVDYGNIKERLDRLITSGAIPPTIVVMPGCKSCWWINSAKSQMETAFWTDLVPSIDQRYRSIPNRNGRLIAGVSAGGYGAVRFAMKYPDRIAAVAALSPAIYNQTPPLASRARILSPFVGLDGQFNQALWTEQNYPRLVDGYFGQNYRVPFYLLSGDHDRLGVTFETALLFKVLLEKQPFSTELRVVSGDHRWGLWSNSLDDALRYLYRFVVTADATAMSLKP